jgi:hypothetical protein
VKITVKQMIDDYYSGNRAAAAESAGVTLQFLNNWVSQEREVMRLDNGNFILVTKTQKVFKRQNNDCVI